MRDPVGAIRTSPYFDEKWYSETYKDVSMAGLDPAYHFAEYGVLLRRDPSQDFSTSFYLETHPEALDEGKNPILDMLDYRERGARPYPVKRLVLAAAANMADVGRPEQAIHLAERFVPRDTIHAIDILRANVAISRRREAEWLSHFNKYLKTFGIEPVRLERGGSDAFFRLSTADLEPVEHGPLVSVIMPAWNAEGTIELAIRSILNQTWRPIELIVVDDASTDTTWTKIKSLAREDSRIRPTRNGVNVGPYVSKNRALDFAQGKYITGHDADDWAHPQRLQKHVEATLATDGHVRASVTYMIRMLSSGFFTPIVGCNSFAPDGVTRISSISTLFEADLLRNDLGYWDSVRVGADSEMIARARKLLGERFGKFWQLGMICLNHDNSLTNHSVFGHQVDNAASKIRSEYRESWQHHHSITRPDMLKLSFPQRIRSFQAPEESVVSLADIERTLS